MILIKVNTLAMPMPKPIYSTLSKELTDKIEASVKEVGLYATAQKYYQEAGMSFPGLYHNLKKQRDRGDIEERNSRVRPNYMAKPVKKAKKLSSEERQFLEDLKTGKKDISEISRLVAVRVFEKMLKYPDDFKFFDFYQAELLKLKKEEQQSKNTLAMELINRLFSGQLPPTHCPKCGTEIIHLPEAHALEEAEIIKND